MKGPKMVWVVAVALLGGGLTAPTGADAQTVESPTTGSRTGGSIVHLGDNRKGSGGAVPSTTHEPGSATNGIGSSPTRTMDLTRPSTGANAPR